MRSFDSNRPAPMMPAAVLPKIIALSAVAFLLFATPIGIATAAGTVEQELQSAPKPSATPIPSSGFQQTHHGIPQLGAQSPNDPQKCPAGTTLSGGKCVKVAPPVPVEPANCPAGTSLVAGRCVKDPTPVPVEPVTCPAGTTLSAGKCVKDPTPVPVEPVTCPVGTTLKAGKCVENDAPPPPPPPPTPVLEKPTIRIPLPVLPLPGITQPDEPDQDEEVVASPTSAPAMPPLQAAAISAKSGPAPPSPADQIESVEPPADEPEPVAVEEPVEAAVEPEEPPPTPEPPTPTPTSIPTSTSLPTATPTPTAVPVAAAMLEPEPPQPTAELPPPSDEAALTAAEPTVDAPPPVEGIAVASMTFTAMLLMLTALEYGAGGSAPPFQRLGGSAREANAVRRSRLPAASGKAAQAVAAGADGPPRVDGFDRALGAPRASQPAVRELDVEGASTVNESSPSAPPNGGLGGARGGLGLAKASVPDSLATWVEPAGAPDVIAEANAIVAPQSTVVKVEGTSWQPAVDLANRPSAGAGGGGQLGIGAKAIEPTTLPGEGMELTEGGTESADQGRHSLRWVPPLIPPGRSRSSDEAVDEGASVVRACPSCEQDCTGRARYCGYCGAGLEIGSVV